MKPEKALALVKDEYEKACREFDEFHSSHEGYAVILEELDELWDEVRTNPLKRSPAVGAFNLQQEIGRFGSEDRLREWQNITHNKILKREAIQVAAMAIRFLVDICEE